MLRFCIFTGRLPHHKNRAARGLPVFVIVQRTLPLSTEKLTSAAAMVDLR